MKKLYAILLAIVCYNNSAQANDIAVSQISLSNRNKAGGYVLVNFTVGWENSFRISSGAANYDAAWVFIKYKVGDNGEWKPATINNGGHSFPSGCSATQPDNTGLFVYRSSNGTGSISFSGIQLRWNYGTDGVGDDDKVYVKVFAVEMVYIPQGSFQVGSGGQNLGEYRQANDVSSSGTSTTFTITSTAPTLQGNNTSSSDANLSARNGDAFDLGTTTNTASLATGYPTGYGDFYCMKYEISQGQYRDFLNTLTYTQQAARTENPPNSSLGTGALSTAGADRNGIEISSPGVNATTPAVYGCDLNGNNTANEASDGEWVACNYLSWEDVIAYLDWAGLRPITELEYEKACRGDQSPVPDEYAWGNTTATFLAAINNNGQTSESSGTTNANANNGSFSGPHRVGMFATSGSSRAQSGSSYYGVMDLSGNLWEQVISIGSTGGRSFTGATGNGSLASNGFHNVSNWPDYNGGGKRGGGWFGPGGALYVSFR
ncbi:MAG: hypothetical protein FGM61_09205, partial [Sediminibacterium sp.]|nr:hypothetical protein [Sediminibacterium sp.]